MVIKLEEQSEEWMVEAARHGHLESFAALYQRYYGSMVALAYSLLANRDLAEDAVQETFAIACHDLPNLRRKGKFAAWLGGICRNVARQMRRRENRAVTATVQQPVRNPDNTDDRADAIRRAVWNLRPADRELIVLRYYDNLPYEQIASVLDISIQAVNGRLIRAKRKIAAYLKRTGFTGDDYEKP
jgi:RNA polymerase sigma-70 factor (ECF subfamily)